MGGRRLDREERHHLQPQYPDRRSVHDAALPAGRAAMWSVRSRCPIRASLIDNIAVRFEDGRIVDAKASRGEEVLNKVLDTDEGARRLGEVALVPHSSPISKSGLLFFNTLVRRERRLPYRARPVLLEVLCGWCQIDAGADRGAGRQQELDSHRLDDRLGHHRHRWAARRWISRSRIPQGRVGLRRFRLRRLQLPAHLRATQQTRQRENGTGGHHREGDRRAP